MSDSTIEVTIHTPGGKESEKLIADLSNKDRIELAQTAETTVKVFVDKDQEAALELLAKIVTAQPWYIGAGIENPLAESLKQTVRNISKRKAIIDAAANGQIEIVERYSAAKSYR